MIIDINEEQRQLIIFSLAILSIKRPGFDIALNEIAIKIDNVLDGRAVMYDEFIKLNK